MAQRQRRTARQQQPARPVPTAHPRVLRPGQALAIPLVFSLVLLALSALPAVRAHPRLLWSFWGTGVALLCWNAVLFATARRRGRALAVQVQLRPQHYLQACAQSVVLIYWGWYWPQVYASAPLLAAQLAFAYAFEALLAWSHRDTHTLGFGPIPVILSTNLFLWFKPDWFYLQFLMIAVGFAAKDLIRWTKDGRRVHIFNPSSFALSVFSIALLATGATHLTWGPEIATTQLLPPYIYVLIFLVSLPGQLLYGVALMTLSAVATTYAFSAAYHVATGTHYFIEPSVPIAVFLGMHLLFTDPSTSPRTESGRVMFGILYGLSVIALVAMLERAGAPTFYDKLLGVPVLNLAIQLIDRAARSSFLRPFDLAAIGRRWTTRRRHLAFIGVWAVLFAVMQMQTAADVTLARGDIFMYHGRVAEALESFQDFVDARPQDPAGYTKLGSALLSAGRPAEALPTFRRAVELQPADAEAHNNLGVALLQTDKPGEAADVIQHAVMLRPGYAEAHYNLAQAYAAAGHARAAADALREALRLRPDWPAAMGALAWLQVTQAERDVYNPGEAMKLATRAADLSGRRDVAILDALAASYAAAGQFDEAARTAEAAERLAIESAPHLVENIRARLARYRSGQPLVNAVIQF
jgi:tetratricopeptide (TPR) repeat protein